MQLHLDVKSFSQAFSVVPPLNQLVCGVSSGPAHQAVGFGPQGCKPIPIEMLGARSRIVPSMRCRIKVKFFLN